MTEITWDGLTEAANWRASVRVCCVTLRAGVAPIHWIRRVDQASSNQVTAGQNRVQVAVRPGLFFNPWHLSRET